MLRAHRTREVTILDRVYEHISLPPLVVAAVDTRAFQRLRSLHQLGASSFLYPGAVHTRFEHSIGVAHMARTLLLNIQRHQPDLGISAVDIELGMLAGLFHDIGHGPFSHLFEDVVSRRCGIEFNHEAMSERIARRVLGDLIPQTHVDVVVGLMRGTALPGIVYGEIISNKRNGIDVDRLDYFIRDSVCCFGKPTVDVRVNRLFNSARMVCEDGHWQLAFEQKLAVSLREIFTLRAKLHKNVYQHQVTKAIGHMIGDIIHAAAPYFTVGGHTLVECAQDETLFLKLGDWVLEAIESSEDPRLAASRAILHRLRTRDIYRVVFSTALDVARRAEMDAVDWEAAILAHAHPSFPCAAEDFVAEVVVINQGKGASDPLESVLFFNPKRPSQPLTKLKPTTDLKHGSPLFTPLRFEERTLMVFERRPTNGAVQRACERLSSDSAFAPLFTESLPFYNTK
ncbi:HD domain containing protein [Novymonas esmeraldas]|uniref:HD domain containing protein n=1 Tax=Novymonas esmeraldas TaxID=1808958 RepID=A0AAW0EUS7_9TRYP